MTSLRGDIVLLRSVTEQDLPKLLEIINKPEVIGRWGSAGPYDIARLASELVEDDEIVAFVIELEGKVVGSVMYSEELEPDYRHAAIDIFVDPDFHGRGIGTDSVRTMAHHLVDDKGHHRLTIDPTADNAPAIACYRKVGFRPVGIMRRYEQGPDGWHDGLLMDLLAEELS